MIISKVISGGQTGVDEAALRAAKARSIPTGGTMPCGFKTLAGARPEFRELYGMLQHASDQYPPRTRLNVEDSDVTVRIAVSFRSPGELLTARECLRAGKPMIDVTVRRSRGAPSIYVVEETVIRFAVDCILLRAQQLGPRPLVVNFAGNSEQTAPGIGALAEQVVGEILDRLKGPSCTP